jgi:hypothetical protein
MGFVLRMAGCIMISIVITILGFVSIVKLNPMNFVFCAIILYLSLKAMDEELKQIP